MEGMNNKGLTLIELIIVIAIIGILVVALTFEFQGWVAGYNVESQIKTLHVDLMNARARAMQRNRMHFMDLTDTQYTLYEDTDPAPNGDGDADPDNDAEISDKVLEPRYPITSAARITFDNNGLADDDYTICSNTDFIDEDPSPSGADYDCIIISTTRINLGQLSISIPDEGECNATNCVER